MLKLRIWGESAEIERMIETVCNRTPNVRVLSVSKPYKDRGSSVYERCYMDIEIHEIVSTPTEEMKIKKLADKLADEKSNWKVCDFDDQYYVNLLPTAQRLYAAYFGEVDKLADKITELQIELEEMKKDRNYWFGEAHRNYEDCKRGYSLTAVNEFADKLESLLIQETVNLDTEEDLKKFYSCINYLKKELYGQ